MTADTFLTNPMNGKTYLKMGLRQNWQMLVFYTVLLFLSCIMATVTGIDNALESLAMYIANSTPGVEDLRTAAYYGAQTFRDLGATFAIVSCFVGVFAGMSANGYVNSRKAVHLYHSLPMSRDALYLTNGIIYGVYYLAAGIFSLLVSTVAIAVRLGLGGYQWEKGIWLIFCGIGAYLVVFCLFQLAGSLTGTAVFRFCMAGIIAFLPVVLYLLIYIGVDTGMRHIEVQKYFSDTRVQRYLCPAINILYTMDEMHSGNMFSSGQNLSSGMKLLSLVYLYATAAVYYIAGLFCHRKRASERSEYAMVWKKVGLVVKYPVVFVCAAYGGLFFREVFGSGDSWLVFGGIIGLVLSFFLMNVLLERNTKSMFRGLRGLGITALAAVVYYAVLPFDVLGLDRFMYQPDKVSYIQMEYYGSDIIIDDPVQVDVVMTAIRSQIQREKNIASTPNDAGNAIPTYFIDSSKVTGATQTETERILDRYCLNRMVPERGTNPKYYHWTGGDAYIKESGSVVIDVDYGITTEAAKVYNEEGYHGDVSTGFDQLSFSVYPNFGLPIHRYIRIPALSADQCIYEVAAEIVMTDEKYDYLETMAIEDIFNLSVDVFGNGYSLVFSDPSDMADQTDPKAVALQTEYYDMLTVLLNSMERITPEMANEPKLGTVSFSHYDETESRIYYSYPLYSGMTDFWQAWKDFSEMLPDFMDRAEKYLQFPYGLEEYAKTLHYEEYELYDDSAMVLEWLLERIPYAWVIEAETGESLFIEKDQMPELFSSCILETYTDDKGVRDSGYMVVYIEYTEEAMRKASDTYKSEEVDAYSGCTWFREGCVPAFVTAVFED